MTRSGLLRIEKCSCPKLLGELRVSSGSKPRSTTHTCHLSPITRHPSHVTRHPKKKEGPVGETGPGLEGGGFSKGLSALSCGLDVSQLFADNTVLPEVGEVFTLLFYQGIGHTPKTGCYTSRIIAGGGMLLEIRLLPVLE